MATISNFFKFLMSILHKLNGVKKKKKKKKKNLPEELAKNIVMVDENFNNYYISNYIE